MPVHSKVVVTLDAKKDLNKLPNYIRRKFLKWMNLVSETGIAEARKIKSFHDEPLHGNRHGQRSIRLNRSYRAFYVESEDFKTIYVTVIEVNKHDY